jgi:hypothetical protein
VGEKTWTVEIAIPFAALGIEPPVAGDIWRIDLCRVRRVEGSPHEYSAFAPTFGLFNKPKRFADLIFK